MASQAGRVLNRLFVNNLPWTVGHRELLDYFSQFGQVQAARVVFDKSTGLSQRYGFVEFSNKNSAEVVINKRDHRLEGNFLTVQPRN